ncbi:hypothetical protein GTK09_14765 [Jiella sp. 40Bstr34]|uniref:Uncharacterized protein n=1 Tax=Jiella pacifica TaxID=2696469 RepID=A0A6N9T650_9HYPH|nr:hypothetical protein [Jiella pacifica]
MTDIATTGRDLDARQLHRTTTIWVVGAASRGVPPARDPAGSDFRNPPPVSTNLHFQGAEI